MSNTHGRHFEAGNGGHKEMPKTLPPNRATRLNRSSFFHKAMLFNRTINNASSIVN